MTRHRIARQPEHEHRDLGEMLRHAREGARMTQELVAARLGLARPAVSQMEAGIRRVLATELAVMAELYGKSLSYFIRDQSSIPVEREMQTVPGLGSRCRLCGLPADREDGSSRRLVVMYGGRSTIIEGNDLEPLWKRRTVCDPCADTIKKE